MVLRINFKQISQNITTASRKIEYIVIHDTGNKSNGANAEMHYRYFNNSTAKVSADFCVDSTQILQVNDYNKYICWHCGDGRGQYGITNTNSVGIEMCINADGDYNTMLNNTVWLVKHLMVLLGIPINKVVRHYDASRKICPATMSANAWQNWYSFKRMLTSTNNNNGSISNVPMDLQRRLNIMGYGLAVDGIVGQLTRNAIMDFQKFFNLTVDGIAGNQTNGKLTEAINRKNSMQPPFRK